MSRHIILFSLLSVMLTSALTTSNAQYKLIRTFGSYGTGNGQFNQPTGIAIGPTGSVYVTDYGNNRVEKFNNSGGFLSVIGTPGNLPGQLGAPEGIATDGTGNIYVGDGYNQVNEFTGNGVYIKTYNAGNSAVALDKSGDLFVTDGSLNSQVQEFNTNGVLIRTFGSYGSGAGQINIGYGIATDNSGNVYVTDVNNHRIDVFNNTGTYLRDFGNSSQLSDPFALYIDNNENIFVANPGDSNVVEYNNSGTMVGEISGFNFPSGVAIDSSGDLFVANNHDNDILEFAPSVSHTPEPGPVVVFSALFLSLVYSLRRRQIFRKTEGNRPSLELVP